MLAFLASGFFLYRIREALAIIGCAILLAIAIRPLAKKIDKLLGRKSNGKLTLASILAYALVLAVIAIFLATVGPIIIQEMTRFISNLPKMISNSDAASIDAIGSALGISDLSAELAAVLENLSKTILGNNGVFSGIGAVGSAVTNVVLTLIMTLFFMLEGPDIANDFWEKLGARRRPADAKDLDTKRISEARKIIDKMAWAVSTFVDKKVVIAIINGLTSMVAITILTIIFKENTGLAVPLGMIAMFFCIIPMFGQFVGGIIITFILLLNNPFLALIWAVYYSVYSTIESNVFEPKIQGDALELRPIVVLIAVTIGTYAMGFMGTFIAIPIAGCVKILLDEYPTIKALR